MNGRESCVPTMTALIHAAAICCCAGGCLVGPDYRRPAAPVAPTWNQDGRPGVVTDRSDLSLWWSEFNDPHLNGLISTALGQNLLLREAYLRIVEARARRGVANGELFPDASNIGSYSHRRISPNGNPFGSAPTAFGPFNLFSYGFDAGWELDFWGKYRRLVEGADAEVDVAVEDYHGVMVTLLADVATEYVSFRAHEERLVVARSNDRLQKHSLRIASERFKAGLVGELDVAQATASVRQTEAIIPTLEIGRQQAVYRLCVLLGIPPQELGLAAVGPPRIPLAPREVDIGLPVELLRQRPDIRSAEREIAARNARIGVATAELYPQFSLAGTITVESRDFSTLFSAASIAHSVGPSFRWNILNFGRLRNNVRAKVAQRDQAVAAYRQQVLRAAEEVESALVTYVEEQQRMESLTLGVASAERAVQLAQAQYERGLIGFERVLDSQRTMLVLQEQLVGARSSISRARISLYKALGGGWRATRTEIRAAPVDGETVEPNSAVIESLPAPRS